MVDEADDAEGGGPGYTVFVALSDDLCSVLYALTLLDCCRDQSENAPIAASVISVNDS